VQVLFISLEPGSKDKYTAARIPPTNFKTKCIYITKNEPMIPDSEFEHLLNFSEFCSAPLQMMLALAEEVYFPLITNPLNQEGWPEVITKEVQESLHRFLAQVYTITTPITPNPKHALNPEPWTLNPKPPPLLFCRCT
jgi:hypothetical protein